MEEKRCIYKGNSGEKRIGTRVKKGILLQFQKFKIQNRELLGLHEISSQIPRNSDERIGVDGLDQTHRLCARRGAHPRESREKKLPMGRVDLVCKPSLARWLLLQCSGN
ncbi:hypothetical protein H5410_065042 [Solanum commersonii]|uniref:Uncharacterized protein n=1 Tax=Solanum commersonii TaxID=4109 RepID=A0A9J5VXN3_SOLCO|nr:hypothetical protein H5410_065042 [Solanum commersonii]